MSRIVGESVQYRVCYHVRARVEDRVWDHVGGGGREHILNRVFDHVGDRVGAGIKEHMWIRVWKAVHERR